MFRTLVTIEISSNSAAAGLMIADVIEGKIASLGGDATSLGGTEGEVVELSVVRGLD
ncbi:MAG TPA: hypothetical protein VKQ29_04740 [Aliidongia sp.]|nr:hypothetical protein [Aliidongia sp.]